MKKIISGRRYDTDTARKLGEKDYFENGNWQYTVSLYKKQTGEFFLGYCGNSMDIFWANGKGDRIEPITIAEAKRWAEEHLDGDEYETIFGAAAEDTLTEGKVQISFWVPAADKEAASKLGVTHAAIYRKGLEALTGNGNDK